MAKSVASVRLGGRIRAALAAKGLTGRELASKLGVVESTVSQWLSGRSEPDVARLEEIAAVLGVDAPSLAFGDVGPSAPQARPVPDVAASIPGATAVQGAIATGQRELAAWLAEYSARLLEAAAADARRQLAGVVAADPALDALPHAGGTPELKAALDRKVIEQLGAPGAGAGESGPRKKRSAG